MVDAQNKYLLITTPLNQLFNIKKNKNIIFLGPKQRDLLKNPMIKDLKIIGTTWGNRDQFSKDISYINNLFDKFLISFCDSMNKTFNVKYNPSYWRLYVGTNIFYITVSLYERWQRINYISKNFKFLESVIINTSQNYLLKKTQSDLIESLCNSDLFNHILYSKIILFFNNIKTTNENYVHSSNKILQTKNIKNFFKIEKKA